MVDLEQIHELVTKFIYCLDLFYFLCLVLFLNTKAENYKSFTNVSKFFLNIYVFGLFTLIIMLLLEFYAKFLLIISKLLQEHMER